MSLATPTVLAAGTAATGAVPLRRIERALDEEDGLLLLRQDVGHRFVPLTPLLGAGGLAVLGEGLLLRIGQVERVGARVRTLGPLAAALSGALALRPPLPALLGAGLLLGTERLQLRVAHGGRQPGGESPGMTAAAAPALAFAGFAHFLADDGDLGVGQAKTLGQAGDALLGTVSAVGGLRASGEGENEGGESRQANETGHGRGGMCRGVVRRGVLCTLSELPPGKKAPTNVAPKLVGGEEYLPDQLDEVRQLVESFGDLPESAQSSEQA